VTKIKIIPYNNVLDDYLEEKKSYHESKLKSGDPVRGKKSAKPVLFE